MTDADIILRNGRITTLADSPDAPAEVQALAIRAGSVLAIGDEAEIERFRGERTVVYDLDGARAIPGLIDSHVHTVRAGVTWGNEVRWEELTSLDEALGRIAERAATTPEGTWILVIGAWDEQQFTEGRVPTLADLDAVAPRHPVYVQKQYSEIFLNTSAIAALDLSDQVIAASPAPEGFTRDDLGTLTGHITDGRLMTWFFPRLPVAGFEAQIASNAKLSLDLAAHGITGVIDGGGMNTGPESYRAISETNRRGLLKTRTRLFKHGERGTELEDFAGYVRFESPGSGDPLLRVSGLGEILMYRSHDRIAVAADYGDDAMAQNRAILTDAAAHGWSVQVHIHQRELIDKMLTLWEDINETHPITGLRWSLVHAELLTVDDAERLRALGAGVFLQSLLRFGGEKAVAEWGAERASNAPDINALWDAGVPIGLGSDGMRAASFSPFASIHWFLTGITVRGTRITSDDSLLSRERALRGYSERGAWFTFEENERGRLLPGYLADIAVLDADYFEVPVDEVPAIRAHLTFVGGEAVHDDGAVARA